MRDIVLTHLTTRMASDLVSLPPSSLLAMLLSFRTLWYSHKLRTILHSWREYCVAEDKAGADPVQCRVRSITPEGIGTVFVDHLELASETDHPPLFPQWLAISMSCRALSCMSAVRPGTPLRSGVIIRSHACGVGHD